jgi:hypothetical protein
MLFLDEVTQTPSLVDATMARNAATLRVGPGQTYATIAAAIAASRDGDTLLVHAGTYIDDFTSPQHRITLQAVGGMVVLQAAEVTTH